jgi:CheY-like chemotaxis protein
MKHILIVGDSDAAAYLFRRYFERNGFRVTVAFNGKSALKANQADPIDEVITDFRVLGMDGKELVNQLKKDRMDLPAIFVSHWDATSIWKTNTHRYLIRLRSQPKL